MTALTEGLPLRELVDPADAADPQVRVHLQSTVADARILGLRALAREKDSTPPRHSATPSA